MRPGAGHRRRRAGVSTKLVIVCSRRPARVDAEPLCPAAVSEIRLTRRSVSSSRRLTRSAPTEFIDGAAGGLPR